MTITRINNFQAKVGNGDELFESLKALQPMIAAFEGCLACSAVREEGDENHIVIIEMWETVEAHKAALSTVPLETFAPVMALVAEPPSGAYYSD